MTCPLTNQGRMLNFIDSLSKKYHLDVFFIDDENETPINKTNITYHKYKIHSNGYSKIIKHSFFWRLNDNLVNIVETQLAEKNIDLVICHDLPTLNPGIEIARKLNARIHYDSLEIYTETINQFFPQVTGFKRHIASWIIKFMRYFGKRAEKKMMTQCDIITTVNQSLADYFENTYEQRNIKVIMNCPSYVENIKREIDFRKLYDLNVSDFIFLYQGVLNDGRGLKKLIDAFKRASNFTDSVKLVILGDGVLRKQLQNKVKILKMEKTVFFHDFVSYNELIQYTMGADFGINLLEAFNLSKKLASPNKLFEYIQAEIPVLCSFSPENDLLLRDHKIGIQCDNTVEDISKGIMNLCNQKKVFHRQDFKEAKNKYCWENQEAKLFDIVK